MYFKYEPKKMSPQEAKEAQIAMETALINAEEEAKRELRKAGFKSCPECKELVDKEYCDSFYNGKGCMGKKECEVYLGFCDKKLKVVSQ